jgi:hypothetical protein
MENWWSLVKADMMNFYAWEGGRMFGGRGLKKKFMLGCSNIG